MSGIAQQSLGELHGVLHRVVHVVVPEQSSSPSEVEVLELRELLSREVKLPWVVLVIDGVAGIEPLDSCIDHIGSVVDHADLHQVIDDPVGQAFSVYPATVTLHTGDLRAVASGSLGSRIRREEAGDTDPVDEQLLGAVVAPLVVALGLFIDHEQDNRVLYGPDADCRLSLRMYW